MSVATTVCMLGQGINCTTQIKIAPSVHHPTITLVCHLILSKCNLTMSVAVFGWLNGSELSTEERGDVHVTLLAIGFIKGALFEEFLQLDRRQQLRFRINVAAGTASE